MNRFKSSDWLKEGNMTWIIFDNIHVWKVIHVAESEIDSLLSRFYGSVRTKKIYEWGVLNKYWLLFYSENGTKLLYPQ